ncbi:hypothetical protein PV328_002816 [Microctonus aethiopoides]|uniref:Sialin n=1 Tax=Microctonus aethiopoides TaxID=144406 RepID=A0AA39KJU1_9HYME|nr:hypothetical protein PV328_002816 [Microctonus aethiopoides]
MVAKCNSMNQGNKSSTNNPLIHPNDYQNNTNEYQEVTTSHLFPWNEYEQGLALGSYFWIYIFSQIPGGIFARKYGAKLVFGMGNLLSALLGSLLPVAMNYHLYALIFIQVIQGLLAGVAYPAVHDTAAKWIPQNQISGPVGIGLTYPISALLINLLGWKAVFYFGSLIGIIWYLAWYFLAFDTPMEHPRISEKERTYILNNLETSVDYSGENKSVPWRKVFTSVPFLTLLITNWTACMRFYVLLLKTPAYLAQVHG